ncbi:uncharacterized protein LOC132195636 [Neocloeon triangulifer]|uniref:uncharacterized protein LOC132195636 n=1 Tax=Neocloeon triangulifer TaxID=2078957 RepID=UPI00286EFC4B|nr:uncharacterized protein LOC132195636 [Neocloeon triangulifer]
MIHKITLVALLCAFAVVYGGDKFEDTKPCSPEVYKDLDQCCAMPKLLPKAPFNSCMDEQSAELEKQAEEKEKKEGNNKGKSKQLATGSKGAKNNKPRSRSKRDTDQEDKSKKGIIALRRRDGPIGGPMCIVQCVFKNQTLLNDDGSINAEKMIGTFVAASSAHWSSLVQNVSGNCYNEFNKINFTGVPSSNTNGTKVCMCDSAMVLSCIRRQLTIRCPDDMLVKSKTCKERINALKECDPFAIPAPKAMFDGSFHAAISAARSLQLKRSRNAGSKNKVGPRPG